jgi:dTDP-D-glucose 4,6-dehydratase
METFHYKYSETVDEAVTLAGGGGVGEYENIQVFIALCNYGEALRQHNEAASLRKSENFVQTEGGIDISYAIAVAATERIKASPEEKAAKTLGITPDQLRAALALVKGRAATV